MKKLILYTLLFPLTIFAQDDLQTSIDSFKANAQVMTNVIEGDSSTMVTTPQGNMIPTVLKVLENASGKVNHISLTVNSMTALEVLDISIDGQTDGSTVRALGYSSAGDGGGGIFRLDTSAATLSPIVRAVFGEAGKRWIRLVDEGVLSIRHFGAVGDYDITLQTGTDDTAAVNAAVVYALTQDRPHLHIPKGTFMVNPQTPWDFTSNSLISGEGKSVSTLYWQDSGTPPSHMIGSLAAANNHSGCVVRDLHLRGDHDSDFVHVSPRYLLYFVEMDNLLIENCEFSYSRDISVVNQDAFGFQFIGNHVHHSSRDGVNFANTSYNVIANNRFEFIGDDAIAGQTAYFDLLDKHTAITGNILRFCGGMHMSGGQSLTITGNTIEYFFNLGIEVKGRIEDGIENFGLNAVQGITIAGNTIKNGVDRLALDAFSTDARYIYIGGAAGQAEALAAIPGENDTGTGTVIDPYPYFENLRDSNRALPIPGNYAITIVGNTLARDIPDSGLISALGRGIFYMPNGEIDPTLTSAVVRRPAITYGEGISKNVLTANNNIMGLGIAFNLTSDTELTNAVFKDNIIYDCTLGLFSGSSSLNQNILLEGNIFDLDPFLIAPERGANGTWLNENRTILDIGNVTGVIVKGNHFKNAGRVSDIDPVAASNTLANRVQYIDNFIYGEPLVEGFDTTNRGMGHVYRSAGFTYVITDSNPASATFGEVLNFCHTQSIDMPTSGRWVRGHTVHNFSQFELGGAGDMYLLRGWYRATTGNAHVLDVDWFELQALTGN